MGKTEAIARGNGISAGKTGRYTGEIQTGMYQSCESKTETVSALSEICMLQLKDQGL